MAHPYDPRDPRLERSVSEEKALKREQESSGEPEGASTAIILGVLVLAVILILLFSYGIPVLREGTPDGNRNGIEVNVGLPGEHP